MMAISENQSYMLEAYMDDPEEFDWAELAELARNNTRPHAGHFSWETNREFAEWGVLSEFCEALDRHGVRLFASTRHRGQNNDPPDCEATGFHGELLGIEITELVDPDSAAAARAEKPYDWKDWRADLVPTLQSIIEKKDTPTQLKGGPYAGYILIIHTDEPWLEIDRIQTSLRGHVFAPTCLITQAYLLISYDPFRKEYPLFDLRLPGP